MRKWKFEIETALALALEAHGGAVDKAGAPYILHPLRLAARFTGSEPHFIAALLHDVVEDSGVSLREIADRFGLEVAGAVDALTRRKPGMELLDGAIHANPGPEPYLECYIPRLITNRIARAVKLADLADNMDITRVDASDPEAMAAYESRCTRYRKALALIEAA